MNINKYLDEHENKDLLRLLTCGSVDDGKSTLIGRLLYDSKLIYDDQLSKLKEESETSGNKGDEEFDYSLLLDGLKAEREQGITIDVAYRYFSTPARKFIIADTPGHEQYTRNMATGASTADLAIILIDARKGVITQTKRHSFIVSLLGIKHVVVAVNKMDLVDYDGNIFNDIRDSFNEFSADLNLENKYFIPLSALKGDNVVNRSEQCDWYTDLPLLERLEAVSVTSGRNFDDFRFYNKRPSFSNELTDAELKEQVVPQIDSVLFAGLTAQLAAKEATLPTGFKMHVAAAEPDVQQPIAFCLDDRGRVWVTEGNTYPKRAPEGEGKDRILVFEL